MKRTRTFAALSAALLLPWFFLTPLFLIPLTWVQDMVSGRKRKATAA